MAIHHNISSNHTTGNRGILIRVKSLHEHTFKRKWKVVIFICSFVMILSTLWIDANRHNNNFKRNKQVKRKAINATVAISVILFLKSYFYNEYRKYNIATVAMDYAPFTAYSSAT